jgi:hypothetical protein
MKRTTYPPGLPYDLFAQWDWYRDAPAASRHKGVAHYDRERLKQPLQPIVHALSFEAYEAPPAFVTIPESWGPWEPVPAGYFHGGGRFPKPATADGAERETADYTLRREPGDVAFPWRVEFADAAFSFRTLAIAETAIPELLKIRKASHPKPTTLSKRAPSCVFFTAKRQRELPEDKTTEPETELVAA